jgi:ABC-2 type transport system ATP-binding protein
MKDVAALCRRVVIIAAGRIMYDGSLSGIVESFSRHKIVTLHFADGSAPRDLSQLGEVVESRLPKVKLRVDRAVVTDLLARVLAEHAVEDVNVEDAPLEQVIAEMFSIVSRSDEPLVEERETAQAAARR